LDSVLKNRNKNNTILEEDIIKNTQEKNIIFVLGFCDLIFLIRYAES
jgi:hypothetical protein